MYIISAYFYYICRKIRACLHFARFCIQAYFQTHFSISKAIAADCLSREKREMTPQENRRKGGKQREQISRGKFKQALRGYGK